MIVRGYEKKGDIISIELKFFVGGNMDVIENKFGISHFVEHLILRRAMSVDIIFDKFAGTVGAGTSRYYTEFRLLFHRRHFDEIIDLFVDIFRNYKNNISKDDMKHEMKIIYNESYDRKPTLGEFSMMLYDKANIPVAKENIYASDLENISLEDIYYWINKYYVYENARLYCVGEDVEVFSEKLRKRLQEVLPKGERNKLDLKLPFVENFRNKRIVVRQTKEYPHPSRVHLIYKVDDYLQVHELYVFRILVHYMMQRYMRNKIISYNVNCSQSFMDDTDLYVSLVVDTADMVSYSNYIDEFVELIKKEIDTNLEKHIESLEIDFYESKGIIKDIIDGLPEGYYDRFPLIELETLQTKLKNVFSLPRCVLEVTNKKREFEKYRISYISRMKQLKEIYL